MTQTIGIESRDGQDPSVIEWGQAFVGTAFEAKDLFVEAASAATDKVTEFAEKAGQEVLKIVTKIAS